MDNKRPQRKRIKQSPKLPAEERREQLLLAAHELFAKQGYRATGTDEIAKRAGLTKGALYFHFASKEEILLAMVKEIIEGHSRTMDKLAGRRLTPAELLVELRQIDCQMPMPEARRNLHLIAEVIQIPRVLKVINAAYERSVRQLAECLDPAYGRTLEERRRLVELLHALYDGINFAGMIHPQLGDLDRQVETLARLTKKTRKRERKDR